jgi:hypothetical protein
MSALLRITDSRRISRDVRLIYQNQTCRAGLIYASRYESRRGWHLPTLVALLLPKSLADGREDDRQARADKL